MECMRTGCFLIGVTGPGFTRDGNALLGSVSDDPYDVRTFLRAMAPTGSLAHVGTELVSTSAHTLAERGYFARLGETTRGINASGLAFTCAMVFEDQDARRSRDATPYPDLTERMMATSRTVDDAIDLFASAGATQPAYSVLLADAAGTLAHLEVGNFGVNVNERYSRQDPGAVFAVNCYLSPKLVEYNAPGARIDDATNNNQARRDRGVQLADELRGELDVSVLARLLSDHANRQRDPLENPLLPAWGYSICNHGTRRQDTYKAEDLPWGTVSAEILEPARQAFWYAYGWPCGGPPEYGDQIFQDKSWGRFVGFRLPTGEHAQTVTPLTTVDGEITAAGSQSRID